MCRGKMWRTKMEGWLVKAPERTGRGRMEEEWSLSAGECRCTSGGTGAKRTQPGTAFARAFGFDILRNTKCFWIFTRTFFTLPLGLDWLGTRSCTLLMRNTNTNESRVPPAVCVAGGRAGPCSIPARVLQPEQCPWWLLSTATAIILIIICQK